MFHLKISIPSYRQVFVSTMNKSAEANNSPQAGGSSSSAKSHFVYHIEVGFLGEYGNDLEVPERQQRGARFYRLERRYSAFLALHNELRKRYRLPCEFPPKKLRNTTPKVLETRRQALEQYLQSFVRHCQKSYNPLPHQLLDFLQVASHVPKVTIERVGDCSFDATHRPVVGFVSREPFLFETSQLQQSSYTGLPDIVTQATLQCFYG